jgi:pimeloyl-ACP methyl ester carboxylesterase
VGLVPLQVHTHGSTGPQVVLLHGGPGAPGSVTGLARALASSFCVLEPLQRRSGVRPLSVDRHVEDLAAIVRDPVRLVGWSWGAMLGLSFVARHPGRVRSLTLIGCGTYDEVSRASYRMTMDERLDEDGRSRLGELRARMDSEADPARRDRLFAEMAAILTRAQSFDPIDDAGEEIHPDARGYEETWRDVLRLQDQGIEPAAFSAIQAPVLMLHGDDDPHPGPATRDVLRAFIPYIEYLNFARCGHAPWLERHAREPFLRVLGDHLRTSTAIDSMP